MSEQTGEQTSAAREMSDEEIAQRAYEISQGEDAGNDEENWQRAERELRGETPTQA